MKVIRLNPTLWDDYSAYLRTDRKMKMGHSLRSRFNILATWFVDKEFTRANFNLFVDEKLKSGMSNAYLNVFVKTVKLLDKYFLYKNPAYIPQFSDYTYFSERRDTNEDIDYLTWDEMFAIRDADIFKSNESNARYRILVQVLIETGARISEVCNLLKRDVVSGRICFRDTKSNNDRWVVISPKLERDLKSLNIDTYVFCPAGVKPLNDRSANDTIKDKARKAGVNKRVYAHLFRHSYCSLLAKSGVNEEVLAKIVGHASPVTTKKYYIHTKYEEMTEALYTFHPSFFSKESFKLYKSAVKKNVERITNKDRVDFSWVENSDSFMIKVSSLNEKEVGS